MLTLLLAQPLPAFHQGNLQAPDQITYIYVFNDGALLIEASGQVDGVSSYYNYSSISAEFSVANGRVSLEIRGHHKVSLRPARPGMGSFVSTWKSWFKYNYFSDGETLVMEASGAKNTSEEVVRVGYALSRSEYRSIKIVAQKQSLKFHINLNISLNLSSIEGHLKTLQNSPRTSTGSTTGSPWSTTPTTRPHRLKGSVKP